MSEKKWQYGIDLEDPAKNAGLPFLKFLAQFDDSEEGSNFDKEWAKYLVEGAENNNDVYCHRLLIAVGTQWIINHHQHRKFDDITNNTELESATLDYLGNLLLRIMCFEEPNKVFKWTKYGKGRKENVEFIEIFCVALPELRRKDRLRKVRAMLKEPKITRRQRQKLSTKEKMLAEPPCYLKRGRHEHEGSKAYYKQRSIETITSRHRETAQYFFDIEQKTKSLRKNESDNDEVSE